MKKIIDLYVDITRKLYRLFESRIVSAVFYAAFGLLFIKFTLITTMFSTDITDGRVVNLMAYLGLGVMCMIAGVNMLQLFAGVIADDVSGTQRKESFLWFALLTASIMVSFLCWIIGHHKEPFIMCAVVAASYGRRIRPVLAITLVAGSAILLAAYVASVNGYIPYLTYDMGGKVIFGHAFGMNYRTDLAAHVLYLVMAYAVLRGEKLMAWEYMMLWFDTWITWRYSSARMNCACMAVFLIVLGIIHVFRLIKKRWPNVPAWSSAIHIVCFLATMVMLFVPSAEGLDSISSGRISLSRRGFEEYGVTAFGQVVEENGLGGIYEAKGEYFFLDIVYIRMIIIDGAAMLLIFMILMTLASYRAAKHGEAIMALALVTVAVVGMIEHHGIEIWYNTYVLVSVAALGLKTVPQEVGKTPVQKGKNITEI